MSIRHIPIINGARAMSLCQRTDVWFGDTISEPNCPTCAAIFGVMFTAASVARAQSEKRKQTREAIRSIEEGKAL